VATAFYAIPKHKHVIQVDINPHHLGAVVKADVCVHADIGVFLDRLLGQVEVARQPDQRRDRPPRLLAEDAVDGPGRVGHPSTIGRISTKPPWTAGIFFASSIAVSRSSTSTMK